MGPGTDKTGASHSMKTVLSCLPPLFINRCTTRVGAEHTPWSWRSGASWEGGYGHLKFKETMSISGGMKVPESAHFNFHQLPSYTKSVPHGAEWPMCLAPFAYFPHP